ncbi:MAG: fimbrillin family protein, partial [Bacteroidales bacterium]|nr:fimbrillin family protein [Bacteroidales bacterium]
MLNRIIRIAAAACTLLIWTGCVRTLGPAEPDGEIRFTAGSPLLRDDATKSGTPKTGTAFSAGDQISVFAWHGAASELITFGTGTPVTLGNSGAWTYAPVKIWEWGGNSDYYDFMAIHPYNGSYAVTSSPLSVTFNYDATVSQDDLMTAGIRRRATDPVPTETVPLTFTHRL